ncbi:uncharacterized protein TOT_010000965 [Theileria orientalis strain Shintoku]|uniref:J domain-containing protein n=1 Tax=Theileria orientalis strain Shintoku TaxID=869250 RepID=J4D6D4_THEOR|nr:uncharacterized protein TOT_010000965 [Theileria orientalis strain Shintoku]PVC53985.1 hypothetical protein MACL_00003396 [Theileria orientalis]BAM39510.1 uncharacterized protein TOT_010000965 [Theileria orientalis strain Shintoku]|eukprot:XP_009689811.1 uncharacterized protein TOT_010000965 [Theileria orientalis strain Shintoku]
MMDSQTVFRPSVKRKTLDSPTDDVFELDVDMTAESEPDDLKTVYEPEKSDKPSDREGFMDANVQTTVRVDGTDPDFYYKIDDPNSKSQTSLSKEFLSNFMLEFTEDELAAKRTVETIYSATGSFAYTYRSLDDAFFSRSTSVNTLMPFVKALASVADESMLLKILEEAKINREVSGSGSADKSLLLNFELILLGHFRPIKAKLGEYMGANFPLTWKELNEFTTVLFKNGILTELNTFFTNVYGIYEIYMEDFKRYLMDLRMYVMRLNDCLTAEEKKTKKQKAASLYSLHDCVDIINFIASQLDSMRKVYVLLVKNIMNTPVTDNLEKVLASLEKDLRSQALLKREEGEVSDKVSCIRMLLDEDSVKFLGSASLATDNGVCRDKFNAFFTAYQQELQRRTDESSEFQKKKKFKRDSVQYVLDRLEEQRSNTLPANCKNPFYTVGIAPKLCNQDTIKKCAKKLKTLLHPDTEHDAEWKQKSETAFKEASLALYQCVNLIDTFSATMSRVGPVPPYLSHLGLTVTDDAGYVKTNTGNQDQSATAATASGAATTGASAAGAPGSAGSNASDVLESLYLFFPDFTIRSEDAKVGALSVELDLSNLAEGKVWQGLGRNKHVSLFVHRPLHNEPLTVHVPPELVSSHLRFPLSEPLKNRTPIFKVDAVQPIQFGSSWKYYVGVKVCGDRGSTLVSWRPVFIELSSRGRSASHVARLLSTFVNASFVSQPLLQEKLKAIKGTGSKAEAERFLVECTKKAQSWADEN